MTRFQAAPRVAWTLALLTLVGAPLAVSALAEDLGPAIGTTAPDIGTRLDQIGKPHRLPDVGRDRETSAAFRL